MFKGYWQKDRRWANDYLGDSKAKIKDYGCTISSIVSLGAWYGSDWTPKDGARKFKFTRDGRLYWQSVTKADFPMDFVWRYYRYDRKKMLEILRSKDNSLIVEVNNGSHWMAVVGYSRYKGFKCYDPYYNDYIYATERYKAITGFTEFTRAKDYYYDGIDVSHWNGKIDFDKLKTDFIVIKATQGEKFIDSKFERNQRKAREKGMKIGYYHFLNNDNPKKEAKHFKKTVGKLKKGEFLVLDAEKHDRAVKQKVKDFFKELGGEKILYTGDSFCRRYGLEKVADYNWIARYGINNGSLSKQPQSRWDMWQYTSRGKLVGIKGYVDLNVSNKLPKGFVKNCESLEKEYKEIEKEYEEIEKEYKKIKANFLIIKTKLDDCRKN